MMLNRQLNRIDRNILRVLQDKGRISYVELGRQVGLTTTPCMERVKKLEKEGFITGYSANMSAELLNAGLIIFVQIKLDRTSKANFNEFRRAVRNLDQIQECYLVSGSFDYLLKARVANMNAYRAFLEDTLLSIPSVQESTSIMVMDTAKESLKITIPY